MGRLFDYSLKDIYAVADLYDNSSSNSSASSNTSKNTSVLNDIFSTLGDIDSKYDVQFRNPTMEIPESLNLEKIDYNMPTQDELYNLASESLASKKYDAANSVENSLITGTNSIEKQKDKLLVDVEKANKTLDAKAAELKKEAVSNAIRRGLARSSIKDESVNKVDTDTSIMKDDNRSNAQLTINSLNEQINRLVALRDKALADIDASYGLQTDAKVQALYSDALKNKDSATKYNNTIDEKEQKYIKSVEEAYQKASNDEWNRISKLMELQSKYGASGVTALKMEEKYNAIKNFFDAIDAKQALELFNSSSRFNEELGNYYKQMKEYLEKRAK